MQREAGQEANLAISLGAVMGPMDPFHDVGELYSPARITNIAKKHFVSNNSTESRGLRDRQLALLKLRVALRKLKILEFEKKLNDEFIDKVVLLHRQRAQK